MICNICIIFKGGIAVFRDTHNITERGEKMDLISIGVSDEIDQVYERLTLELDVLSKQGIDVCINQRHQGSILFLDCSVSGDLMDNYSYNDIVYVSKHYIANAISNIIIDFWEMKILRKIVDSNYYYFSPQERERILAFAGKTLGAEENYKGEGCIYRLSRKARVLQKILDYLDCNSKIIIDGFVRFRMRDYIAELEDAVDRAVEEYLMEREYNEFIKLLRYFVEIQEPKVDTVNILKNVDGSYKLLDGQGHTINSELLDDLGGEVSDSSINYDDLLISSLITLAPSRIVFHSVTAVPGNEILDTIKKVFHQKVAICHGCDMCYMKKPLEKE